MKNIVIISTSLRNGSNSEFLAHEFSRGAKESGNNVDFITLNKKKISYCIGCLSCQKTGKCVINDDAVEIAKIVKEADVLVFATPVYYYGMSGQMKTLLDRMNPLYGTDYKFRDVYVIATAADTDTSAMDGTITGMQGWIDCFENAKLCGVINGVGINDANDAKNHADVMKKAYIMGKEIK